MNKLETKIQEKLLKWYIHDYGMSLDQALNYIEQFPINAYRTYCKNKKGRYKRNNN